MISSNVEKALTQDRHARALLAVLAAEDWGCDNPKITLLLRRGTKRIKRWAGTRHLVLPGTDWAMEVIVVVPGKPTKHLDLAKTDEETIDYTSSFPLQASARFLPRLRVVAGAAWRNSIYLPQILFTGTTAFSAHERIELAAIVESLDAAGPRWTGDKRKGRAESLSLIS